MLLKKSGNSSCSLGDTYYIYQIRDISSKLLKITPIFKSDDDTDGNNYGPISLLSNFYRVFDKVIHNRLTSYI